MSQYIITYQVESNGKKYETHFAGFIERSDPAATAKFGGPFIDYATKRANAKRFNSYFEARETINEIAKQIPNALTTHEIVPVR